MHRKDTHLLPKMIKIIYKILLLDYRLFLGIFYFLALLYIDVARARVRIALVHSPVPPPTYIFLDYILIG